LRSDAELFDGEVSCKKLALPHLVTPGGYVPCVKGERLERFHGLTPDDALPDFPN
jgi:hypothetical protein